jgi:SAM-dependent methyltransferase
MDFFRGDEGAEITIRSDLGKGEEETHPVAAWFREPDEDAGYERKALELARGRILDVGAGTGVHALPLQRRGLEVCAIDFTPEAVEIMRARGVRDARLARLEEFRDGPFDTILVLANGAGLAETLDGLEGFLGRLGQLLAPDGQVLLDSCDVRPPAGPDGVRPATGRDGRYVGDIHFQLEYRGEKGDLFPQLYVDPDTFADRARRAGWSLEVVEPGEGGSYLARLTRAAGRASAEGPGAAGAVP